MILQTPDNPDDPADDTGSTLLLTIFYGFLALVVILLVVAASSLYLERKRLLTLADGAALAAAEAYSLDAVTVTPDGSTVPLRTGLDSSAVRGAADAYLAAAPHATLEDLTVTRATSSDGRSATVSLSAYWRPPVLTLLLPAGVPLEVTAVARSVFR
jgi:uncharacterized membrane protein